MKFKEFWSKIKSIKHFEIYLAVIIGLILCLFYFAFFVDKSSADKKKEISTEEYSSTEEYVDNLENRLCNVLEKISGVTSCSVVVTLESGFSFEYATDKETNVDKNGNSTTVETIVFQDDEPVIVKENYPEIKGVVIVAKGSEDIRVKLDILEAVTTIFKIDESDISILY